MPSADGAESICGEQWGRVSFQRFLDQTSTCQPRGIRIIPESGPTCPTTCVHGARGYTAGLWPAGVANHRWPAQPGEAWWESIRAALVWIAFGSRIRKNSGFCAAPRSLTNSAATATEGSFPAVFEPHGATPFPGHHHVQIAVAVKVHDGDVHSRSDPLVV